MSASATGCAVADCTRGRARWAAYETAPARTDISLAVYVGAVQTISIRGASTETTVGAPSNRQENWSWKYHHILHNAGQDTVYDTLCRDIVGTAMAGTNATIMAYGQVRERQCGS